MKALLDRQHVAPGRAHAWLAQNLATGWASCPLTENGCLRVLTNPRYAAPVPATDVLTKLATAKTGGHYEFWADDLTITDAQVFDRGKWRGHQQVTDAYNDGNLESDSLWTYTWDAENRLIQMQSQTSVPEEYRRKLVFEYDWQSPGFARRFMNGMIKITIPQPVPILSTFTTDGILLLNWMMIMIC